LGQIPKSNHPLALFHKEAGVKLLLKGEVQPHQTPIKGQVHNLTHTMVGTNPPPPLHMPYLASLNIPDLSKLMNDPILHDPTWPAMPTKLPSDILNFEGKAGEDPSNHIMTFHLWCSSNNIMDDSIRLRFFQRTLTGPLAKWYVDEKSGSHITFE
jgi:hypothetical protein